RVLFRSNRLVGDRGLFGSMLAAGQRTFELGCHDLFGLSGVALRFGFADADDDAKTHAECGFGFSLHVGIGFAVIGTTLAMSDDHERSAGVLEHGRRDVAGVRAAVRRMAVLS